MDLEQEKSELKKLFDHYMVLAEKRISWAQTWIADAYFWGWGTDKDYKKFIEWDIKAARNGSYVSKRRMMLYYQSFGDVDAVMDLSQTAFRPTLIAKHKLDYPAEIEFAVEEPRGEINLLRWSSDEYKECFSGADGLQLIDEFEAMIDNRMLYSEFEHGEAFLSRAVCYIFGFGIDPDLNLAMELLVGFDSIDWNKLARSKGSRYSRNEYYSLFFDALHYYCCLREAGIEGSYDLDQFAKEFGYGQLLDLSEGALSAYQILHSVKRAFDGDVESARRLGILFSEQEDAPSNEGRRLIYHDDSSAMTYIRAIPGINPDSRTTAIALKLSSDPDKNTFDWIYSYNLCLRVEENLADIPEQPVIGRDYCSRHEIAEVLTDALLNLACNTSDEAVRRNIGKKLQSIDQEYGGIGDFRKGQVYSECFSDYYQALECFDRHFGGPNEYSKKCRKKLLSNRRK